MKATTKLLVAALAAAGTMVAVDAAAQSSVGRGSRGGGVAMSRGGGAGVDHGGRGWSGGGRWNGGNHWHGGGRPYWGGSRYWGPGLGFYFGVPVLWGGYYYGSPYWDNYYPRDRVVYREVVREGYPEASFSGPTTEVPRGEGAPSQGPLYMNYCDSAKAYFPKVTACPEGWKLRSPTE